MSLSSPRSIVRRNISFPAPRPFHPTACTRRQRITHQPSTGPSSTPVAASPQSSPAFSPQQFSSKPSPGNAAAEPNPHSRPTAHQLPAGSFFGGFRTPAPSGSTAHTRPASETLHDTGRSTELDRMSQADPIEPFPFTGGR